MNGRVEDGFGARAERQQGDMVARRATPSRSKSIVACRARRRLPLSFMEPLTSNTKTSVLGFSVAQHRQRVAGAGHRHSRGAALGAVCRERRVKERRQRRHKGDEKKRESAHDLAKGIGSKGAHWFTLILPEKRQKWLNGCLHR